MIGRKKSPKIPILSLLVLLLLLPASLVEGTVTVYQETFDSPWNTGDWYQYSLEGGAWATQSPPFVCQGDQSVSHHDSMDPVNSWILSQNISLKAGITYTCSHLQRVGNKSYPENMGTYIYQGNGADFTPASATAQIWQADDLKNETCATRSGTFTVPSDGNYSIVFHCTSAADEFLAVWDDVRITKPTVIELVSFTTATGLHNVLLFWETASELDSAGFYFLRSETEEWGYERITAELIPAKGSPTQGASYQYDDRNVAVGKTYYYKLEDVDTAGNRSFYGPVSATVPASIPTITDFNPKRGAPGMTVVITGTNFTGTTVKFGGTDADSFTVDSETQITAVVGYGATGKVTVTTDGGTATSAADFIYDPSIPTLNEWAMILFSILLVGSGVIVLRRRNVSGSFVK